MNAIEERLAASDPARRDEPLLTDEAAGQMLAAILHADSAPRRRRRRKIAIGGAAISLAVAGSAIAAGGAPDFVRDALKGINDYGLPVDLDRTHLVASVKDGSDTLELYRTPAAEGGRCWNLVRRDSSGDATDESGTECGRGPEPGLDISGEGVEGEGWSIYGELPPKAAVVELRVPGEPMRRLLTDNGYVIDKTSPGGFDKGYEIVIRDRDGAVIAREREEGTPPTCDVTYPNGAIGPEPC